MPCPHGLHATSGQVNRRHRAPFYAIWCGVARLRSRIAAASVPSERQKELLWEVSEWVSWSSSCSSCSRPSSRRSVAPRAIRTAQARPATARGTPRRPPSGRRRSTQSQRDGRARAVPPTVPGAAGSGSRPIGASPTEPPSRSLSW